MGNLIERIDAWIIALGFAAAMLAAWGIGWRHGRTLAADSGQDPGIKFTDASMALLGLLLGFTFSMSLGKHDQRRAMVVVDSNAIGDFYTCASLIEEPNRTALQGIIRDYATQRLAASSRRLSQAEWEEDTRRIQERQARMTELVGAAISRGTPIAVPLTNTLNGVTSSNASRIAAYRDRLPWSIVLLLFLSAVAPTFLMGRQQGSTQKLSLSRTLSFIFLVAMVIYVTLDLNQPSRGTITVSQESMERLIRSMSE